MSRENSANSPPSDGLHIHQHFPLKLSIPKFLTSVMQSAEVKESLIEGSELQVEVRDEGKESFVWLWLSKGDVQRKISAARKVLKEWEKREEVKEVKIFIPSDMVAVIIGKRGRQVASIQDKTHTSISFHDRSPESTPERVVTIEGSPDSISSAIEIIHTTVINHRCYEKKRGKLTVKIERKTEDSGKCREVVGLTDDVMMGGEGYIIIEGSLGECVGPVTRLIELIDSHKSESSQESVVLVTPSRKTTKMNEVMRHMREKLREVELEYTQLDDQETKITLKGDIANRKFAVRSILEAIEHRSRSESGESRHRSRSKI